MVSSAPRAALPGSFLPGPSAVCLGPLPPLRQGDVAVHLRVPLRPADRDALVRFAADHDLRVRAVRRAEGAVHLRGSVLALERAFGTRLRLYAGAEGTFCGRRGALSLPIDLVARVTVVEGLDQRPFAPGATPPRSLRPWSSPVGHGAQRLSSRLVSANPGQPARRAPDDAASPAGRPTSSAAAEDAFPPGVGGCGGGPAVSVRAVPAARRVGPVLASPSDPPRRGGTVRDGRGEGEPPAPVSLASHRARRRGPLVRAAADQRLERLARALHPAGSDRS